MPKQTVLGSLSQRHSKVSYFVSEITDYILAGIDRPKCNQTNTKAGD